MDYIPYTYLIGWSTLNKWYYGVEYGMKKMPYANPNNLWVSYFTSSKTVSQYRTMYGEPDVIQIRKTFPNGTLQERMENSINWEKKVLSKIDITNIMWLNGRRASGNICPETNKKIALLKYGVNNVFQAPEIKEKIKNTNLKKYGVEHPSYSAELLERKKQNNIEKYGVGCTLTLPHIRKKAMETLNTEYVKNKRKQTILHKYGVEYIGSSEVVKNKAANTRRELSNRDIVKLIREYQRVFQIVFSCGWYQASYEKLESILFDIQNKYGIYTYDEISQIQVPKKYSSSIKKLQERPIVKEIKKYKEKYKRKITIGLNWDRKSEEYLEKILQQLIEQYGLI